MKAPLTLGPYRRAELAKALGVRPKTVNTIASRMSSRSLPADPLFKTPDGMKVIPRKGWLVVALKGRNSYLLVRLGNDFAQSLLDEGIARVAGRLNVSWFDVTAFLRGEIQELERGRPVLRELVTRAGFQIREPKVAS